MYVKHVKRNKVKLSAGCLTKCYIPCTVYINNFKNILHSSR